MNIHQAAVLLNKQDNILIISHRRPDGDTIGSAAALCLGLRYLGKTTYVLPNLEAHALFTPYLSNVTAPPDFVPDFVVAVDTASIELMPDNAQRYRTCVDLSLDHHGSNTAYAKQSCTMSSCAACGELIYLILKELIPLSSEIALLLYVAISTDTGCFVYSNTTAATHRITAELLDIGFDFPWVNKRHFRTKSLRRLRLESSLIEHMQLFDEGRTAISLIALKLVSSLSLNEEDMENIAAFLEQVEGVENAVTIRELQPGEYKISLRTGGQLNASDVCALLGGGGHPAAAGCTVYSTAEEAVSLIRGAILKTEAASTEV